MAVWKQLKFAIALALPLLADDRANQLVTATQAAKFQVAAAGTVRVENSFGEVDIAGWDRPEVDVKVTRASERYHDAEGQPAAQRRVNSVLISTKQEGNDVIVSTVYPGRNPLFHPLSRRSDVELVYGIHAPRASKIVVGHNSGTVNVSDIHNEIRATVINGQITLTLAPGQYAVDAKCRLGDFYSDFDGRDERMGILGEKFNSPGNAPSIPLFLRVRIGDIVLVKQNMPPAE